ncbi:MAG: glycoside hydrolase family 25 protein [Rhodobacteraceae bacterium]|nr:glycoside hydrolase family 25 protein [Paracoccaceae bacterium]
MRWTSVLPLCLVIALAACGGGQRDRAGPEPAAAGPVVAPNFGDADPVDWKGRAPSSYPVHGIDTSRWQGAVDWRLARANGVSFGFLKATEGGDILDPAFKANWRAARAAGVPVGAYHFWYHCRPAAEQARWFIRHVPRSPDALPPVLDMEWTPFSPTCTLRPAPETIRREAKIFLDALEAHYGQRPIIYSAPDFFDANQMWRLGNYDFWLRSVAAHPRDVYAGRHWTFWQYTGTGLVPGVAGKADINVFAGSEAAWRDWLVQSSHR